MDYKSNYVCNKTIGLGTIYSLCNSNFFRCIKGSYNSGFTHFKSFEFLMVLFFNVFSWCVYSCCPLMQKICHSNCTWMVLNALNLYVFLNCFCGQMSFHSTDMKKASYEDHGSYEWIILLKKMRAPRSHSFSSHMSNRHLWKLKKSKSWGPL